MVSDSWFDKKDFKFQHKKNLQYLEEFVLPLFQIASKYVDPGNFTKKFVAGSDIHAYLE